MASCHKSLLNGWFKGWVVRSSCTRPKIAPRLLCKISTCSKAYQQYLPPAPDSLRPGISTTAQEVSDCCANWLSAHVTVSDSHSQTTARTWPHTSDMLSFPTSWAFIISVSWPEAERSLPAVVTTTSHPDAKQSRDGTANLISLWQAECSKVGLSTFYQCFLSVRFFFQIKEQTEISASVPACSGFR